MHRYHTPHRSAEADVESTRIIPSYFLGRPSRVYVARFRRRSAAMVSQQR
jgi:hypothetical protein